MLRNDVFISRSTSPDLTIFLSIQVSAVIDISYMKVGPQYFDK